MILTDYQKEHQRVVCAAITYNGIIVLGARHGCRLMRETLKLIFGEKAQRESFFANATQGFVDQYNNFLTREEAYDIAEKQSQIIRECGNPDQRILYSEHLY
jgi:hypothetical protein